MLNTGGWALAFPSGERPVSARRLLAARLAGDAINYLTPSATVGVSSSGCGCWATTCPRACGGCQ